MSRPAPNDLQLRVTVAHLPDLFHAVAWAPDGKRLASGSLDRAVRVWDVESGKVLTTLEGHTGAVRSVSWCEDGKRLASGSDDGSVRVWEVESGKVLATLEGHTGTVRSVSWCKDGKRLASGSFDKTVHVWELESGKVLRSLGGHVDFVSSVSWCKDGKRLASGSHDKTVRVWEVESGKVLRSLEGHTDFVNSVSWCENGKRLASGSHDKTVRVWEVESGKVLRILRGHASFVRSVSWCEDGKRLASGSYDRSVRVWDVESGKVLRTLRGHTDYVSDVSWCDDWKRLASGSGDRSVRVWDVESGKMLATLEGHTVYVSSVSPSEDGKRLASGSGDRSVRVWDVESGKMLRTLKGHTDPVRSLSWCEDGKRLASGSDDRSVRVWDVESVTVLATLKGHTSAVTIVSWSEDGRWLASGSDDRSVRVWDVEAGKVLRTLKSHVGAVTSVSWCEDGRRLASGSYDNTVRVWDVESGKVLRILEGHTGLVFRVSWSKDGKRLASGSYDNTVRVWDVESGKVLATLEGHTAAVSNVCWSEDGKCLVSGSSDHTVRVWDLEGDGPVKIFTGLVGASYALLDLAFRPALATRPWYGTTPLGDPDICVKVLNPGAESSDVATPAEDITQVISAKVVLVGESNVGKSYLAHRIATGRPPAAGSINSTHGMTFWALAPERLSVEAKAPPNQRRDVVLWDMGGQEEYRLIHQLFLHDTTVALMLFDPTRGAVAFKEVATWNKYLEKQLRDRQATKLLVGAKVDQPSDTFDRKSIEEIRRDTGCASFHESSAITGRGVDDLCTAVAQAIDWNALGKTSRPLLYQRIRDEIEVRRLRGEVVVHVSDLHGALGDEAASEHGRQAIATVADQLASQGVIARSRMANGEPALVLQVHEIERYAGSLIIAARNNPRGVPALDSRDISKPTFAWPGISSLERLKNRMQEKAVLECTVELLVEHGICFFHEGLLVFPSLLSTSAVEREPETLPHVISLYYDISGAIDNIYASLVSWLVLAKDFGRLRLGPDRAEFEVADQGLCGLRKVARSGGYAHVDVYFEDKTPDELRDAFITFVEDHLRERGVELCEHLTVDCPKGYRFDEETLRMALAEGDREILCPRCKHGHPLREGAAEVRKRAPHSENSLWALKTRIEHARKEAAREAVRVVGTSASAHPEAQPIRLLHLSDLHFTADTQVSSRVQWLIEDLKSDAGLGFKELDYLVVSGDFTDKACVEGFDKAREFLSQLAERFALSAEKCILVPGNHDVSNPLDAYARRKDSTGLREGEWIKQGDMVMARDPDKYPQRFKPFSDNLFHKFVQRPYPLPMAEQGLAIPFWETGIQFLALNSCWEIDEFHRQRAGINPESVAHAVRQAQEQVDVAVKGGLWAKARTPLRIAVWHHAVTAPDYKMKGQEFLGHLQKVGVRLALHGDVHDLRRDEAGKWTMDRLHVIGAGSFGARKDDRGESIPCLYNVLEIARDFGSVTVHTRSQETKDGDWGPYAKWRDPEGGKGLVDYYKIEL